ncbi:hypothetical protein BJP25_21080 [Actinokineospora bangkokensis]|uniref:L,D-TPase catalytic domain-containing protein n=1 Tax=Actinokineospora bangkokensis TaxID=1193682 RepID=A0A1Q9LL75_9PSEU|nr:hypothetical protein BJP25_21080 [Actinokineospora bangkokensis]
MRTMAGIAATAAATGGALLLAAPVASAEGGAICGAEAKACVSLSGQQAWLMNGGGATYGGVPITSGKPGYETPTGSFTVTYKDIDHYSQAYNGPMPYSVFFTTSGVAFHQGSLSVQSHGCIHLSPEAARVFYDSLKPGDVVQVVP